MAEAILRRTLKRVVDLASMHGITSDALIAMSKDDYQVLRRAATRARLDRKARSSARNADMPPMLRAKAGPASLIGNTTRVPHSFVPGGRGRRPASISLARSNLTERRKARCMLKSNISSVSY